MAKPEVGQQYTDLDERVAEYRGPMTYVGEGEAHYYFEVSVTDDPVRVLKSRYEKDIVPYTEPLRDLSTGSRWCRTRHDYTGQIAEIVIPPFLYGGKAWVAYAIIVNSNNDRPQVKTEKDFRRIFGDYLPEIV